MDHDVLEAMVGTMFESDGLGRLVGHAPSLYVLRAEDTLIYRLHADLTDEVVEGLERLLMRPRGRPGRWALEYADYISALIGIAPLEAIRSGPLYTFPQLSGMQSDAISIDAGNADLLLNGLDEWVPDVATGLPMLAMIADGHAVSLCTSVHASRAAHCAGVETLPNHRGRGLAAKATAAWARVVQEAGSTPFYSTTFDNVASQGVARNLGLSLIGSEFSITCQRA